MNSQSYVSEFVRQTIRDMYDHHAHLLEFENMWRFTKFTEVWERKVFERYCKQRKLVPWVDIFDLPIEMGRVCTGSDCLRQPVCRPHKAQRAFYNGWVGHHSTTRLVITEPGGLFIGVGRGMEGRRNDQYAANHTLLAYYLSIAGLSTVTDKGFASHGPIKALPKRNNTHHNMSSQEITALSAVRTAICEWPYGVGFFLN
jgi:hypothetical protein